MLSHLKSYTSYHFLPCKWRCIRKGLRRKLAIILCLIFHSFSDGRSWFGYDANLWRWFSTSFPQIGTADIDSALIKSSLFCSELTQAFISNLISRSASGYVQTKWASWNHTSIWTLIEWLLLVPLIPLTLHFPSELYWQLSHSTPCRQNWPGLRFPWWPLLRLESSGRLFSPSGSASLYLQTASRLHLYREESHHHYHRPLLGKKRSTTIPTIRHAWRL